MKKVIFLFLMFFSLTSAEIKPNILSSEKLNILPVKTNSFIIQVKDNNAYNKAQAKILLYKIRIAEERDTIKGIIKDHDSIAKKNKRK